MEDIPNLSQPAAAPDAPPQAFQLNLSVQASPTGHHVIAHFGYDGVNIALDLGPSDVVKQLTPLLAKGLKDAADNAHRADLGLTLPDQRHAARG